MITDWDGYCEMNGLCLQTIQSPSTLHTMLQRTTENNRKIQTKQKDLNSQSNPEGKAMLEAP